MKTLKSSYIFLPRAGLALEEPTNPSKGNARIRGNLRLRYSEPDIKQTVGDIYISRTGKALLQSLLLSSTE
jgi:hypothetical protein